MEIQRNWETTYVRHPCHDLRPPRPDRRLLRPWGWRGVLPDGQEQGRSRHQYIKDQIEDLGNANIPKEVEAAVNKGDYRFVGINDLGVMVPGIDDSDLKVAQSRYGVRVIENTTTRASDQGAGRVADRRLGYALQYNKLLRAKIPAGR